MKLHGVAPTPFGRRASERRERKGVSPEECYVLVLKPVRLVRLTSHGKGSPKLWGNRSTYWSLFSVSKAAETAMLQAVDMTCVRYAFFPVPPRLQRPLVTSMVLGYVCTARRQFVRSFLLMSKYVFSCVSGVCRMPFL